MSRLVDLKNNMEYVWHEEGAMAVAHRLSYHAKKMQLNLIHKKQPRSPLNDYVDVLFINGCDYSVPHPIRYRVDHQIEQLEAVGVSASSVNAWELTSDHARIASTFVIFRCPYEEHIGAFINMAHSYNKRVYFDIDDLVIDTKYTDTVPYVASMDSSSKTQYDDGVNRMKRTMLLCDGVITSTDQLANELSSYRDLVFVNRNVASEEMLYLSERAVYERDTLPALMESEVKPDERHRYRVAKCRSSKRTGFSIGYFSGSITHNADFDLILPAVARFMTEYPDVSLHVVGELDLPKELAPFSDRIVRVPFSPWRRLPQMLSFLDVNLIPLVDSVFNRAKSENKWVEASLVKVPSIASKVGALADSITHGVDGLLCSTVDEWYDALVALRSDSSFYRSIAQHAYKKCTTNHLTNGTGTKLADFLRSHSSRTLGIVLPSMDISGGVMVALKHAQILQRSGVDVSLIAPKEKSDGRVATVGSDHVPIIYAMEANMRGWFDSLVATMWTTLEFVKSYSNVRHRYYLVQNLETEFYIPGNPERRGAGATYGYNPDIVYCTISPWCRTWLEEQYGKSVRYAPNGIDCNQFYATERDWSGKIRILIEGDSTSEYKNVDASFRISNQLDSRKYEVWYLSYKGEAKNWYRVDKFFNKVPHDQVADVYRQCHILLKTSVLESFSYPPLEMMATGGCAVVLKNEGNSAYLEDGKNALVFYEGAEQEAVGLIERIVADSELRANLLSGGLETAHDLDWELLSDSILKLYE